MRWKPIKIITTKLQVGHYVCLSSKNVQRRSHKYDPQIFRHIARLWSLDCVWVDRCAVGCEASILSQNSDTSSMIMAKDLGGLTQPKKPTNFMSKNL